jgi:hypothetical protein
MLEASTYLKYSIPFFLLPPDGLHLPKERHRSPNLNSMVLDAFRGPSETGPKGFDFGGCQIVLSSA